VLEGPVALAPFRLKSMCATKGGAQSALLALEEAEASLTELLDLEDYYFGADKKEKTQNAVDTVIMCAETALTCAEKPSADTHAKACCLKGRALGFIPGQERQAEELLSKALKLNPQLVEAWNALGEVYWNQKDLDRAQNSFQQAVELCGPNVVSLRNLSIVLRAIDADDLGKSVNYAEGLAKAKEATALDANDPQNWETLGNAYMGEFFVNGKHEELSKAMKAYSRAQDNYDKIGKRNPTLHVNRGKAAMYMEDYTLAYKSFQTASEISGGQVADDQATELLDLVTRLSGLVERKGDLKTKRLKDLALGMQATSSLQHLRAQQSVEKLSAKVISIIDRKELPVMLLCCDAALEFFVLSLYNTEVLKVAEIVVPLVSVLQISSPHYRYIKVKPANNTELAYPCIRVAHPGDVSIVGGSSLSGTAAKPNFSSERAVV